MNLVLFDDLSLENLLPLTFTRPVSRIRVGILTIAEKWEKTLGMTSSTLSRPCLSGKFPLESADDNLLVNSSLLPDQNLAAAISKLNRGESLVKEGTLLALRTDAGGLNTFDPLDENHQGTEYPGNTRRIDYPWKIFSLNGEEIRSDMERITSGRESGDLSSTVRVMNPENVFVEPGFRGEHFILNASEGPVYLGKGAEIMEGTVIRGPFALCEGATVKLSAKIYGPTTIGPQCKVGGEVNNSVLLGYSNKGHDGFLGNAVIGEWCNLGADTNNSNLKNNYSEVRIWNYRLNRFIKTGLQFCGLVMGDHSRCGINTMFNTGTVVGVSANIFGAGFPRNFVPSFSWGGSRGFTTYRLDKALETARLVMQRRGMELTEEDTGLLQYVFEATSAYRKTEPGAGT